MGIVRHSHLSAFSAPVIYETNRKIAVVRVIHDLILADGILDTREMDLLDRLYSDYGVKKTEILLADECTLAEA